MMISHSVIDSRDIFSQIGSKHIRQMKGRIWFGIVVFSGLWFIVPLLHTGLPISDDGKDHVARIANFYLSLSEGHIIPRWAENLNWGYGHPILEFLYPLPSYLASLFHFFGFSLIDSTKIVLGIGVIVSGITMYLWLKNFLHTSASALGAILYMYAPYRLIDVYTRGDIGENLAFIFMPLVLYFMYGYEKSQKSYYLVGMSGSFAGLILSHNAISLMYIPFIVVYGIYLSLLSQKRSKLFLSMLLGIVLGFGLAAFFWVPALLEGKYTLRNIVTAGEYRSRFIPLQSMLYDAVYFSGRPIFALEIGILNVVLLFMAMYFAITKKIDKVLIAILFIYTLSAVYLMTPQSDFIWGKLLLLQNFQFPWRFLAVPTFTISVLSGIFIDKLSQKLQYTLIFCIIGALLVFSVSFWPHKGYLYKSDSFFTGIYNGTTDTGESAPVWSIRFMEHRFTKPLEVIEGNAAVRQIKRVSTKHTYSVVSITPVQLVENTLYFPGWNVFVDGKRIPIQFQDARFRGLMTFFVPAGTHRIDITFGETMLRRLADILSLGASGIVILIIFLPEARNGRKKSSTGKLLNAKIHDSI